MNTISGDIGMAPENDPTQVSPDGLDPETTEPQSVEVDYDKDGDLDGFWITFGDGSNVVLLDVDDNDTVDVVQLDFNGDMIVDAVAQQADGGYAITVEQGGEPVFVTREQLAEQAPAILEILEDVWPPDGEDGATAPVEPVPTDGVPAEDVPTVVDGQIVGDAEARKELWFEQAFNGACVPASIAQIVSYYTGEAMTDAAFIELVNEQRAWVVGPDGVPGMYTHSAEQVLDAIGVPATLVAPSSPEQLVEYLAEDRAMIVFVDSGEIWGTDQGADGNQESDHAVTVTGIDTEREVVYLNDTGTPDGAMLEVPLSVFLDAWDDSGRALVACDETAVEFQARVGAADALEADAVDTGTAAGALDGFTSPGPLDRLGDFFRTHPWVLLPIVLGAGAVVRSITKKD